MHKIHFYSQYAIRSGTIDSVSENIYEHFNLPYRKVDSGAWGYYTIYGGDEEETVSVYSNKNYDEGEYFNAPTHKDYPILVNVYYTTRPDDFRDYILNAFDAVIVEEEEEIPPPPEPFY